MAHKMWLRFWIEGLVLLLSGKKRGLAWNIQEPVKWLSSMCMQCVRPNDKFSGIVVNAILNLFLFPDGTCIHWVRGSNSQPLAEVDSIFDILGP